MIKKKDISSIFPIIIKIIKLNFEDVNKFAKSTPLIPNISEVAVFVIVSIDNLNDCSKFILSTIKTPDKINKLIKNEIKIKKEIFTFSSVIFFDQSNKFLLTTLLGLTNLVISAEAVLRRI